MRIADRHVTSMIGEALAILTALMWAGSTVLSAESLKRVDPVRSNAIKTLFSSLAMFPIALAAGELNNLLSVDPESVIYVVSAVIIGFGAGDTLLYKSIILIGVSRAYTIAYTYPLFTMVIGVLLLREPFLPRYLIGTILTVLSLSLLSMERDKSRGGIRLRGLLMALGAALGWAVGTVLVALGLRTLSIILANTIRYPVLAVFLFLISRPGKRWKIARKDLALLSASGFLGMVLGGITFLSSLQLIGASRATPLSASSPVWASLISSIALKEKVTARLILASVIVTMSVYFLI
jgi:DME family drug/metabolite transporter